MMMLFSFSYFAMRNDEFSLLQIFDNKHDKKNFIDVLIHFFPIQKVLNECV